MFPCRVVPSGFVFAPAIIMVKADAKAVADTTALVVKDKAKAIAETTALVVKDKGGKEARRQKQVCGFTRYLQGLDSHCIMVTRMVSRKQWREQVNKEVARISQEKELQHACVARAHGVLQPEVLRTIGGFEESSH